MKNIHFISGLPRSGSTLLSAILSQNPDFHASISSPLAQIFNGAWQAMGPGNEGITFIDDWEREKILLGIVMNFYSGKNGSMRDTTVFDTSRIWTAKAHLLFKLFTDAKMICPVRNVAWVIDSIERLIARNCLSPSKIFPPETAMNVYERSNQLVSGKGMIGSAYNNLREACFGEYADRIMLVDYDSFVENPANVLCSIYKFIDIEYRVNERGLQWHGMFEDISFPSGTADAIAEFDARLNTPGLHSVRGKIEKVERQTILPPEIFAAHCESDFWNKPEFRAASKVTVL